MKKIAILLFISLLIPLVGCTKEGKKTHHKKRTTKQSNALTLKKQWESAILESGLYYRQKKYEAALKKGEEAVKLSRKLHQKDHLNTIRSLNNLGIIQKYLKQYDQAAQSYQEAIDIKTRLYKKSDPRLAIHYSNLGELFRTQKKYKKAETALTKALELAIGGKYPLMISREHYNLARLFSEMKSYLKAEEHSKKALALLSQKYPSYHPKVRLVLAQLRKIYQDSGQVKKVAEIDQKIESIQAQMKQERIARQKHGHKGHNHAEHDHKDDHKRDDHKKDH